jgi:tetratricopeptide (TPR) repeat protein
MPQEWFVRRGNKVRGPLTSEEVKQFAAKGILVASDMVRTAEKPDWRQAGTIKGLFGVEPPARPAPPPLHQSSTKTSPQGTDNLTSSPATIETKPKSAFASNLLNGGKYAASIGTVSGLAADFLMPLGPINFYLFMIVMVCSTYLCVRWWKLQKEQRKEWDRGYPQQALIFCVVMSIAFGLWFFAETMNGSEGRGVIAGNFEQLAQLQESLLGISTAVGEIKQDTTQILVETKRIGDNVEILGKLGGLIKKPETPSDFYHNARIYELSGKFGEAFAAFERYIAFDEEFADAFLSYLKLLRTQRGHEAAVHEFAKLQQRLPNNVALEFVALKLLSGEKRLSELEQFSHERSDFGPVFLDLANFFSESEMPNRSGVDSENEQRYLKQFVDAAERGDFVRFYIDKIKANELLADARGRLTAGSKPGSPLEANKKVFLANHNEVWVIDNTATSISYSFDKNEWIPVQNLVKTVMLRRGTIKDQRMYNGRQETVFIKYTDHRGNESQVYPVAISSVSELTAPQELGQPIDPSRFLDGKSPDDLLRQQKGEVDEILKSIQGH